MKTLGKWVDVAVRWFFLSSTDPKKASLTVKFALLWLVPYVLTGISAACGVGLVCIVGIDSVWLNTLISQITNVIEAVFIAVGTVGAAWAFIRKSALTVDGNNAAFQNTNQ